MGAGPKLRIAAGKVKSFGTLFDEPNGFGSDNPLLIVEGLSASVKPPAGTLAGTGSIPVLGSIVIEPPSGSLVLTTNCSFSDQADAALLSFAGVAPTVSISTGNPTPSAGSLAFTGSAPTLRTAEAPGAAALSLSGSAPSVSVGSIITPSAGALAASGNAPTEGFQEVPGAGALAITGNAPTIISGTVIAPSSGALTLAPSAPTQGATIAPAAAALALAGSAPSVNGQQAIAPAAAGLALAGNAPLLNTTVTPAPGAISSSSSAPQVAIALRIQPPAGTLSAAGAASVLGSVLTPAAGALSVSASSPGIALTAPTGQGALAIQGNAPSVSQTSEVLEAPAAAALAFAGIAPSISVSSSARGVAGLVNGYDDSAAPFAEFYMSAGDILRFGIDWTYWLTRFRPQNAQVGEGTAVRPLAPNGYQYSCSSDGLTQSLEPTWPATIGAQLLDGTAVWTGEAVDTTSLMATVVSAQWSSSSTLQLSGSSLIGQLALVLVNASAIQPGDYDVICTVQCSDSNVRTGKLRVKVR